MSIKLYRFNVKHEIAELGVSKIFPTSQCVLQVSAKKNGSIEIHFKGVKDFFLLRNNLKRKLFSNAKSSSARNGSRVTRAEIDPFETSPESCPRLSKKFIVFSQ